MPYRTGCALWAHDGWVGNFYPSQASAGEFLELYVERMTAVEGNTTFHHVPERERVEAWSEVMPDEFRICPKVHHGVTHDAGRLCDHKDRAADFLKPMKGFGEHLGPFFLQLPPRYGPDRIDDLRRFLDAWPRERAPIAVELRHRGWYEASVASKLHGTLEDLGVGRVSLDSRPIHELEVGARVRGAREKPEVPLITARTAPFAFVRYIGHPDLSRNEPYLEQWAERIEGWLEEAIDVYFFCHCPLERKSPRLVRRMQSMLEERGADAPPLPWNELDERPGQRRLL